VEIIEADDAACVAVAESHVDVQGSKMKCLIGHDLSKYDCVSVGKDEFVPISVKLMTSVTQLNNDIV
jgi:hypothetical protein